MLLPFKLFFITIIMVNYSLKVSSFYGKSYKKYRKEQNKLVSTFRPLNDTERGFQSKLHIDNIENLIVTELKRYINKAYVDIQCSYIFSAQIYMRLIEGLLVNNGQLGKVSQNTDLSFTKEAAQMVATMYNVEAMRNSFANNVMWIVLLFAERVLVYMKSVISGNPAEDQTTIVTVHNSVSLLLERYMVTGDCVDYSKKNKLDVEINGNFDDLQGVLTTLASKKTLIGQRLDTNAEKNISTAGYEQFSSNVVLGLHRLLADIEAIKCLLESSGVEVDWDQVLPHLKNEYDLGTQANGITLSQHMKLLATFNEKFMSIFKVIVIRLMFKFAMYINSNKCVACVYTKTVQECKAKILRDIYELENYLHIQNDGDVKYIRKLFKKINFPYNILRTVNKLKNNLNDKALDLNYANRSLSVSDSSRDSVVTWCKRIEQDVERFVKTFKEINFFNINYSVIREFSLLIQTNEYKKLEEFEKSIE